VEFPIFDAKSRSLKKAFLGKAGGSIGRNSSNVVVIEALRDITMSLQMGDRVGLVGHNGAGKSTTVEILEGNRRRDTGQVTVLGADPGTAGRQWRARIGIVLQEVSDAGMLTVGETVRMFSSCYGAARDPAEVLDLVGLASVVDRRVRSLSGGQRRRLDVALGIVGKPELLFLDEPTTGLDIDARSTLWAAVRELVAAGSAVLLTTHYLEEAEALADRVAVMAEGKIIAAGSVAEIRSRVIQQRIRCITTTATEAVASWPGVSSVSTNGGRVEIMTSAPEAIVRRLLDADAGLHELEVGRAGLADAFVELTAEAA
jgi:ABC-2 type transport system ATP-binding protein